MSLLESFWEEARDWSFLLAGWLLYLFFSVEGNRGCFLDLWIGYGNYFSPLSPPPPPLLFPLSL